MADFCCKMNNKIIIEFGLRRISELFKPRSPLSASAFGFGQFSVFIGQKMQLTGRENANNMRNATCAGTQTSHEWPYCSFLYCGTVL